MKAKVMQDSKMKRQKGDKKKWERREGRKKVGRSPKSGQFSFWLVSKLVGPGKVMESEEEMGDIQYDLCVTC